MSSQPATRLAPLTDSGLIFDPAAEGFSQAFERYEELYAAGSDVTTTGPEFYARVDAQLLPGMAVFSRTLRGIEHRRERRRIGRDGFDHFTVHLVDSGTLLLDADGRTNRLGPGEGVLVDMTRPFRSAPSGQMFTLSISRERLSETLRDLPSLHGTRLANDAGRLRRLLDSVDLADSQSAAVTTLVQAVSARVQSREPSAREAAGSRRERALRFIETHLADPELAPAMTRVLYASTASTTRTVPLNAFVHLPAALHAYALQSPTDRGSHRATPPVPMMVHIRTLVVGWLRALRV